MKKISFSYHLSHTLTTYVEHTTSLRKEILLTPLPPKTDLRYRWEALIEKIYWSLKLDEQNVSKEDIFTVLTNQKKRKLSPVEMDIYRYRYAFDYIQKEWLGSKKPITTRVIIRLYELIGKGKIQDEESLKTVLEYMQAGSEHPLLQAAIILIEIIHTEPFTKDNERIARVAAYVFLYKYGYDVDGLLVLEEYFSNNSSKYKEILARLSKEGNLTPWLEYMAHGATTQLMHVKTKLTQQNFEEYLPAKLFDLTERQQAILSYLDKPGSRITNRKCTTLFGISQITASRELAKMASLGLIFTHGRGRSVYYTKV